MSIVKPPQGTHKEKIITISESRLAHMLAIVSEAAIESLVTSMKDNKFHEKAAKEFVGRISKHLKDDKSNIIRVP